MIEKKIEIYADDFIQTDLNNVELIGELNNNYLVLALSSIDDKKIIAYEYFEFDAAKDEWNNILNEIKAQSKLFVKEHFDCRIFFNSPEALAVPALYNNAETAKTYLNTFYGNLKNNIIEIEQLSVFDNVNVIYSVDEKLKQAVENNFKPSSVQHSYSKLLQQIYSAEQNETYLHLFFYNRMFVIVVIKNAQLQFIKSVNYQSANDVLYFILNVTKQYGLSIEEAHLKVSGFINVDANEYIILQKYFAHIIIEEKSTEHLFNNFPKHYFAPFFYLTA